MVRSVNRFGTVGLLALICAVLASCTVKLGASTEGDKRAVEDAFEQFHSRYDSVQFEDIYRDCDPAFREANPEEHFVQIGKQLHDQFGNVQAVTRKWVWVVADPIPQGKAVYNTTFEKGDATEMSTWIIYGGKAHLAYYQILPGTMEPGEASKKLQP